MRVKLPYMDADNYRRKEIAAQYCAGISDPKILMPELPEDTTEHVLAFICHAHLNARSHYPAYARTGSLDLDSLPHFSV